MGIRGLLALIFFATLALAVGFIYGLVAFLKERLFELFPPDLWPQADTALQILVLYGMVALIIFTTILMLLVFFLMSNLIVRPLKEIIKAMLQFSRDGEKGTLPNVEGTPREIRELASVYTDLVEKVDQVHRHDVEISRVKSDFISTAAHQLRTPLTGIRWALEALEKEPLTESQMALVTSAKEKGKDLVDTVGTLLDITSIESGKHKYEYSVFRIDELIAEVANDFAPHAGQSQVSLYYARSEAPLPEIRADRNRIKWILNNLLENAIRYTPAGGTVRIMADASEKHVRVRVHDTGIGIEDKDRSNIFERFYRAGNAITKQNQGNGLGLYISRTIAMDHGGDLNFASNENGPGTTFTLSLPLPR
ncbi:MAG TPA: HAMP domain-containing sensor histidine kinase [Candidatus Paceibacterota bacterium]|nr:HAMP domain-containing sensor histidine kinase [Candidatus Paceibacterota bacterium]